MVVHYRGGKIYNIGPRLLASSTQQQVDTSGQFLETFQTEKKLESVFQQNFLDSICYFRYASARRLQ